MRSSQRSSADVVHRSARSAHPVSSPSSSSTISRSSSRERFHVGRDSRAAFPKERSPSCSSTWRDPRVWRSSSRAHIRRSCAASASVARRRSSSEHRGVIVDTEGDGAFCVFATRGRRGNGSCRSPARAGDALVARRATVRRGSACTRASRSEPPTTTSASKCTGGADRRCRERGPDPDLTRQPRSCSTGSSLDGWQLVDLGLVRAQGSRSSGRAPPASARRALDEHPGAARPRDATRSTFRRSSRARRARGGRRDCGGAARAP